MTRPRGISSSGMRRGGRKACTCCQPPSTWFYALQQGYDFVHFQVSYALRRFHSVTGPSRHVLYTLYVQWQCVSVRA